MTSIFKETETTVDKIESALMESIIPAKDSKLALTFDGKIAIKRKNGDYVSYDSVTDKIVNHLNLVAKEFCKYLMLMPTNKISTGDIIKQNEIYYYVADVDNEDVLLINLEEGTNSVPVEEVNIVTKNTVYKKVINLFNNANGVQNNLLPLLLMEEKGDSKDLLFAMMAQNGNMGNIAQNPMMMLALMKGKDDSLVKMMMLPELMKNINNK